MIWKSSTLHHIKGLFSITNKPTRSSLKDFDWKKRFFKLNPNEQVSALTKTVLNIMSNFIPNEIILADDRDPPRITSKLKSMIQEKNLLYKKYLKPNNTLKWPRNISSIFSNSGTSSVSKWGFQEILWKTFK